MTASLSYDSAEAIWADLSAKGYDAQVVRKGEGWDVKVKGAHPSAERAKRWQDGRDQFEQNRAALANWTKPYYGVTHLNDAPQGFQITATERSADCADCMLIPLGANRLSMKTEERYFDSIHAAKAWGEAEAAKRT